MPKERSPRCWRCNSPVGKDFIYRDDIKMVFHPKCWKNHKRDVENKQLYARRKILLPIQDKAEQEAKIMPKKETCAKCNRPITNNIKRIKGKAYHSKCREEILSEQYGK